MKNPAPRPRVSDHAVLRFLQRKYGFDVEAVRQKIDAMAGPAIKAGALTLKVDGVSFVLRGGRVVTTLEHGMRSISKTSEARP